MAKLGVFGGVRRSLTKLKKNVPNFNKGGIFSNDGKGFSCVNGRWAKVWWYLILRALQVYEFNGREKRKETKKKDVRERIHRLIISFFYLFYFVFVLIFHFLSDDFFKLGCKEQEKKKRKKETNKQTCV